MLLAAHAVQQAVRNRLHACPACLIRADHPLLLILLGISKTTHHAAVVAVGPVHGSCGI